MENVAGISTVLQLIVQRHFILRSTEVDNLTLVTWLYNSIKFLYVLKQFVSACLCTGIIRNLHVVCNQNVRTTTCNLPSNTYRLYGRGNICNSIPNVKRFCVFRWPSLGFKSDKKSNKKIIFLMKTALASALSLLADMMRHLSWGHSKETTQHKRT